MIINGQRYEAEPAVEAYIKDLQREIARLDNLLKDGETVETCLREQNKKTTEDMVKVLEDMTKVLAEMKELKAENARLEEGYQKSLGVIAATDCAECKKDAEPVKHGEWIKTDVCENQFKCSECGRTVTTNTSIVDPADFEFYCYNCGAKMDGGADDETN